MNKAKAMIEKVGRKQPLRGKSVPHCIANLRRKTRSSRHGRQKHAATARAKWQQNGVEEKTNEIEVEEFAALIKCARNLYEDYANSFPDVHSNRFSSWDDLTKKEKEKWLLLAYGRCEVDRRNAVFRG